MKKIVTFLLIILIPISLYSQEKVVLSHALKMSDFIEISLEIENKPNGNFHLIKIDTITVTDQVGQRLPDNYVQTFYRRANVLARYEIDKKKKYKDFNIKGVIKYFKPSENKKSYFNLGKIKNFKKNINLIAKSITNKNPNILFSIVDSATVAKALPKYQYRTNDREGYKSINFRNYDLIYAYKTDKKQDFVVALNGELEPGFERLTLLDEKTGILYKLIRLKRDMTKIEKDEITIEMMIENENSITLIPFDFRNVEAKNL
ncbi:hypothetical protein ACM642_15915 [Chryseobacterium sp. CY353]